MNRRTLLALPLAAAPLAAARLAPTPAPQGGWKGSNSTKTLTATEARKILADPDADYERRLSALCVVECETQANMRALGAASRQRDLRTGWRLTIKRASQWLWGAVRGV